MNVLVDTSVWSEVLRRKGGGNSDIRGKLKELIINGQVEIIGPVRQELLSGIRTQESFQNMVDYLAAYPDLILESEDYVLAAKYCNSCRHQGIQGTSIDLLICAVAVRRNLHIFTLDLDFIHFSRIIPIQMYE